MAIRRKSVIFSGCRADVNRRLSIVHGMRQFIACILIAWISIYEISAVGYQRLRNSDAPYATMRRVLPIVTQEFVHEDL
jgi:hypothetical protein